MMRSNNLSTQEVSLISRKTKNYDILDFKTALDLFLDDCHLRNLRPYTIRYYNTELSEFYKILRFQKVDTNPNTITLDIIKNKVIRYMLDEKHLKPTTINTRIRAIKAFFNFLYREHHLKNNPVARLKELRTANNRANIQQSTIRNVVSTTEFTDVSGTARLYLYAFVP
jgi:integrase/recombinase XerD